MIMGYLEPKDLNIFLDLLLKLTKTVGSYRFNSKSAVKL